MPTTESSIKKSTLSTFLVMLCTFISRFLGFLRTAVVTAVFGASGLADVINLTFAVPNNLRKLMAEGALSSAFIPVLSQTITENKSNDPSRVIVRNIISFQLLILIPLSMLCIVFAEPLIKIVLAEFQEEWQISLSTGLFRWFINYLLLISISAVLMGVLNSHSYFFIPAITPILFSISVILSIIFLHSSLGAYSMAVGVLCGGVFQLIFQTPLFYKLGYDFKPNFIFSNPLFRRVLKQWGPVLATSALYTVSETIAFRFSSGLADGSTSAMTNALVFWQLPFGIFSASITTVLFPRMSKQSANNDLEGLRESIQYGLRFLFVLLIPSALFMGFFGKELISVAIQRGKFTVANTYLTARVLAAYSTGLFSVGAFTFLQRFFYSRNKFAIPFYIGLFVCILDVTLSYILKETSLAVRGLAYANSISFSIGLFLMLFFVRKDLIHIQGKKILTTFLKVLVSIVPPILFLIGYIKITGEWWKMGSSIKNLILLLTGALIFCMLTLLMYKLTRIEILSILISKRKEKKNEK